MKLEMARKAIATYFSGIFWTFLDDLQLCVLQQLILAVDKISNQQFSFQNYFG